MLKIKSNLKIIIFITIAIIALYFTNNKYGNFSKNKSIKACIIAQISKSKDKPIEEIKIFCEKEVTKKID